MARVEVITREQLRSWGACYSDDRIAERVPPEGITPLDLLGHPDVPACDKIWVLLCEEILGRPGHLECLARLVDRALARVASPDPRSTAVVAALRADAVTQEIVKAAAEAAAGRTKEREAEVAAEVANAERTAQLNDIREMLSK